jgi:hypothetical protein
MFLYVKYNIPILKMFEKFNMPTDGIRVILFLTTLLINIFDTNETIMLKKFPVTDIYYLSNSLEKISIRNVINKYADKNRYYENNKMKNILELENIRLSEIKDKKIYVSYVKLISKKEKSYNLEYDDYHISDLFDLE